MSGNCCPDRAGQAIADGTPNYTAGQAAAEAERCLYCSDAPCIKACPTAIDIPRFIKRIAQRNNGGAAKVILEANILGYSCARVCPVDVLCVGSCVLGPWKDSPIAIGRLQRYAVEAVWDKAGTLLEKQAPNGRRAAIVGAGPAGLAAAARLALGGCDVVVFEAKPWAGGLNTFGVAPHKLQAEDSLKEVAFLSKLGVQLQTSTRVGVDIPAGELLDSFDVVFLGLGLGTDRKLEIPGEHLPGVVGATRWIERMKTGEAVRGAGGERRQRGETGPCRESARREAGVEHVRRAAVIGGGNTALDVAQELRNLGVPGVKLIYRRDENSMSGYLHEWRRAKRLGVEAVCNTIPTRITRESGRLVLHTGPARSTKLGAKHNGSSRNEAHGGSDVNSDAPISADLIVVAVGQTSFIDVATQFPGVKHRGGRVVTDTHGLTDNPKVYAGGDCANGGMEVVDAVAMGQASAEAILRRLRDTVIQPLMKPVTALSKR